MEKKFAEAYTDELVDDGPNPVNIPAVLAFIASLGGWLFVSDKLFFFIPVLAIILSIVAIFVFATSPRPMIGKLLCGIAVGLSLFFLVWRLSYDQMRGEAVTEAAIPIGLDWMEYLQRGETIEAHTLTDDFSSRSKSKFDLIKSYRDPRKDPEIEPDNLEVAMEMSNYTKHENFAKNLLVQKIVNFGKDAEFRHVRSLDYKRVDSRNDLVSQLYEMTYMENGVQKTQLIYLTLNREDRGKYFQAHWSITRYAEIPPPENWNS